MKAAQSREQGEIRPLPGQLGLPDGRGDKIADDVDELDAIFARAAQQQEGADYKVMELHLDITDFRAIHEISEYEMCEMLRDEMNWRLGRAGWENRPAWWWKGEEVPRRRS